MGLQVYGGSHLEVGTGGIAFREEDVERIFLALFQLEFGVVLPDGVQIYGTFFGVVTTADVHYQTLVDEHPHVVVATELKVLSFDVGEFRGNLHGKAVVVLAARYVIVVLGVLYRLCGIKVFQVVKGEESRMFCVVAVVLRVCDVCKPEAFLVHFQVDVAAYGVGIFFPVCVRGDNLGCEPAFNFMSSCATFPGVT